MLDMSLFMLMLHKLVHIILVVIIYSLTNRGLAVSTDTKFTTNVIKITHLQVIDATNRILTFDTKTKRGTDSNNGNITLDQNKDTITLTKG